MAKTHLKTMIGLLLLVGGGAWADEKAAVEYLQRRDALAADDIPGRMMLGQWCEDQQLHQQAMAQYRSVLALDADHDQAYDRLVHLSDTHPLPDEADRQAALLAAFDGMSLHVTAHFMILYNTDGEWARNRAVALERAHDVYYSTFRRVGFKPMPLENRLLCILFNKHEDYVAYGIRYDRTDLGWSAGYYSSRTNRIVFYDERQSPHFAELHEQVAKLEVTVAEHQQQLNAAIAARNHALVAEHRRVIADQQRQLRWYRNRHEALSKVGNTSKTVHEAVHQLAYNSGLMSRRVVYPFWLTEGLATSFETDTPGGQFGPFHPNEWRKSPLLEARQNEQLLPIEELIAIVRPDTDDIERMNVIYSQSWALFGYIFRHERDALKTYMQTLADLPPGQRDAPTLTAEFVEAFGPIDRLQTRFDNYVKRLR